MRAVRGGPLTGRAPDFAVSTGDATDNAQGNELRAYIALLDGGTTVLPDSGRSTRFDGCASPDRYDPRYWYPDGPPAGYAADRPCDRYGFPRLPGLHDACRLPFAATGLGLPWYAGYGNHDHPLDALTNLWGGDRVGAAEVGRLIRDAGNVLAWVNGHDHVNRVLARPAAGERGTWWEITTASHIDRPPGRRARGPADPGRLVQGTLVEPLAAVGKRGGRRGGPQHHPGLSDADDHLALRAPLGDGAVRRCASGFRMFRPAGRGR